MHSHWLRLQDQHPVSHPALPLPPFARSGGREERKEPGDNNLEASFSKTPRYKPSLLAIPGQNHVGGPFQSLPPSCPAGPRPQEMPGKLRATYRSLAQVILLHQLGHLPLIGSEEPAHGDHHRLVQLLLLQSTVFPHHEAQGTRLARLPPRVRARLQRDNLQKRFS